MKKKILVVLLCAVLLVPVFSVPASADSLNLETPDSEVQQMIEDWMESQNINSDIISNVLSIYNLNKSDSPYFFMSDSSGFYESGNYVLLMSSLPIVLKYKSNSPLSPTLDAYNLNKIVKFEIDSFIEVSTTNYRFKQASTTSGFGSMVTSFYNSPRPAYISNHDIKTASSDPYIPVNLLDTVFFSPAVMPFRPIIQTPVGMMGVLAEIVYLIPFLLVLVIGFLAFWKGWRFLLTQLRRG